MVSLRARNLIAAACLLAVLAAVPASASTLKTIATPSAFVDPRSVEFNGDDHPGELRANILLPDDYDPTRRYPVLFLLHGVGDSYASWADPERGDVAETAAGLDAIVVMPEAARGFYTNWWNGGRRGDPAWERFFLEELIPLVERRFPIRRGRRWHAIAGLSMGGLGATFLGSQLPGYFGSVATFSGFIQHQRPEIGLAFEGAAGRPYEQLFGPADGFYASGHNPAKLVRNLRSSRLYVTVGNGVPAPEDLPNAFGAVLELELFAQAMDFVAAAERAGVEHTYVPLSGIHDWPYWRRHLRAAIEWGLFEPVPAAPREWTYSTVSQRGRAWNLDYRFDGPPDELITLSRDGAVLRGEGSGDARLARGRCRIEMTLPFEVRFPARRCPRRAEPFAAR